MSSKIVVTNNTDIDNTIIMSDVKKDTGTKDHHGDDMYIRFLIRYYYPFLLKYNKVICAVFGTRFLTNTKSNLDLPKDSPSNLAIEAFKKYYPYSSDWPSMFIIQNTNDNDITSNSYTKTISTYLDNYADEHPSVISTVKGYWELVNDPKYSSTATSYVSTDKHTMMTTISFFKAATLDDVNEIAEHFLEWIPSLDGNGINVYPTGLFVLFKEMSLDTEKNFVMIDSIVLPIALVILGLYLKSYRHMFVSLCALGCTIVLALGILTPLSDVIDINPFAPSIMLSCGIAVSFDYSLFLLTRFKEEYVTLGKSREDAVFGAVEAAGHVVVLSGFTLVFTFMILISFPQNFLSSVGFVCGVIVLTAVLSNFTLLPSILLAFSCFSYFDLPRSDSLCCFISQARKDENTYAQLNNIITWNKHHNSGDNSSTATNPNDEVEKAISNDNAIDGNFITESHTTTPRTLWFKFAYFSTKYAGITLVVMFAFTAPFLWKFCTMIPSSDDNLVFLRDSKASMGLEIMKASFPQGKLDPYIIISDTGDNGVLTSTYFAQEKNLIAKINEELSPKFINMDSFTALTRFNNMDITYDMASSFFDTTSPAYNQVIPTMYREFSSQLMSNNNKVTMIRIETLLNPNGQIMETFIEKIRSILIDNNSSFKGYLMGGYSTNMDVQASLYKLVPMLVGVTLAVVIVIISWSFGSIFLSFRLIITIFIGLCWTYGLTVMVYQPGQPQNDFAVLTPYIKTSSGIYWIIPIMSFSILVGLALDYDILLISRLIEYRKLGWSDRASISLAVEKTGGIITTAGIIMSVSFAGLLLPKSTVLNQYGFSLFMGVVIDTFLVRTLVVPAMIGVGGYDCVNGLNWWPYRMPKVILSPEEEDAALWAGYDIPVKITDNNNNISKITDSLSPRLNDDTSDI